mgnify:CR=1 FL=1
MGLLLARGDWLGLCLALLPGVRNLPEITGESIRSFMIEHGAGQPTSPHAWGTLVLTAARRGILGKTGRYVPMKAARSHARVTAVYRFSE